MNGICVIHCEISFSRTFIRGIPFSTELQEQPYWARYSRPRLILHTVTTSKYFDLAISGVIGLNVITMAMEFYLMPQVNKQVNLMIISSYHTLSLMFPVNS